jgi:phosphohistidine phosphatase
MKQLLLWRHAEAEDWHDMGDLARRLTPKGREQAQRAAQWIISLCQSQGWKPGLVASPAVRAQQTAETLSRVSSWAIQTEPRIAPGAGSDVFLQSLALRNEDCLIAVGHQPTLGRVSSQLLFHQAHDLSVKKSAVWWFQLRPERADHALRAVYYPD